MRVTKRDIQQLFHQCETAFETCWATLVKIKKLDKADETLAKDLILFQETLALPLFELQQLRNRVTGWEKELIGNKRRFKPAWFTKQMRCLSNYKKGIDQVRNIGKGLGDAFVYFFYRNDLQLLEKQFGHQRIDSTIGVVGLSGEKHFIKNIKHIEGNLTIYHGITNILRYGDFSFYDLKKHRIVEIGELKTRNIQGNQYELMLTTISTIPSAKPGNSTPVANSNLSTSTAARLDKQVKAIINILSPDKNKVDFTADIKGTSLVGELQKLYNASKKNCNNYLKASPGLLYMGARFPNANLYTRIFNRKMNSITSSIGDEAINQAKTLIKAGAANNSIILGNLLYYSDYIDKNAAGTAPLFWYPLSPELLKDLYLSNFLVITVFNPAHILDDLQQRGFNVKSKYSTSPEIPGKPQIQFFDSMITLITNHLQTEESILKMLDAVVNVQSETKRYGSILLKPYLNLSAIFGADPVE